MKIVLVANPTAGRGRVPVLVRDLAEHLLARGATVDVHFTTGPGDAAARVGALDAAAYDRLVVVGGDGTLHEAVNGREGPLPWPTTVVPVGTANLVARDAAIPLRADARTRAGLLLGGTPWPVDLLATDRGRSLAVVGVGIDAEVVRAVAAVRRGGSGGYARWLAPIARTFLDYRPPDLVVSVDGGRPIEAGAVVVQNTRCYGGLFTLSPAAAMDDGAFDVVVLRRAGRRDWFRLLVAAYTGGLSRDRDILLLRGTSVSVTSSFPVAVQADGDPAGTTPLRISLLPRALTLLR